jgi:hypothetical protein
MRRLALGLVAGLMFTAPARAQDPVEYLLDGTDKKRGHFLGQLLLRPQASGALRVVQRATFLELGTEVLEADGKRTGTELRVEFPSGAGLTGGIAGSGAPDPLRLRVRFADEDETAKASTRRGNEPVSSAYGHRVTAPLGRGFPDAAARPAPESAGHTYAAFKGVPFIKGEGDAHAVAMNDISQGSLGDCYFMAGLAAVARSQPERIQAMIEDHGDGSYTVFMWVHNDQWAEEVPGPDGTYDYLLSARSVRVDSFFPAGYGGSSPSYAEFGDSEVVGTEKRHELWPAIFEKAFAQLKGSYGKVGEGGFASTPQSFFSSEQVEDWDPAELTPDEVRDILQEGEREKRPMTLGVPEGKENPSLNLYAPHYYAFWGFDADGNVLLYNPWGSSHPPRGLTMEEVTKIFDSIHVGPK